ncbi:hypothetical protein F2Q68_00020005 [Brassica cretica]|uniref:Uncharacterized protein n=1 Tax=Brassica cretica TaxID=69181 RepID=A0A8S9G121_BRACR|nr:hypothetical protein F2Q68_00020005 [Brassica cretica]
MKKCQYAVLTVTQDAFWKLGKPAQAFCLSFSYLSNPELIFLTMELAKVLVYATILLLTLLLWLFAPPNFLIRLELLLIDERLHWSEPCMALRMSSEASLFREPHHFSTKNKDIHRFTDHQFTISFSHNSVLSVILRTSPFSDVCIPIFAIFCHVMYAANCLRDMECQEEVDIPKAFANPGGDFGIVPAQLVLMSKDHNIHCFSAAILRRAGEYKCSQEASPEKTIHHNLSRKIGIMIRRNKVTMR